MRNSLVSSSDYLPGKEGLFIKADLSSYLIDYYLHRREVAANTLPEHDERLKDLIACFAVHLTLRSSTETHAWTVHLVAEQPYSLFVTGSAGALDDLGESRGFLVGHVLTDHIRHTDVNSMHAQFTDKKGTTFKSYVKSDVADIPRIVEQYYEQSEQLPLRLSLPKNSDVAIALAALPEYDRQWFDSVSLDSVADDCAGSVKKMRICRYDFACDCSPAKLLPFFRSLPDETLNELYGDDQAVIIVCPRCGRKFPIARAELTSSDA